MGRLDFLYRMELPHRAKIVYIYLCDRMDRERKAWPGLNTIAKDLSLSRSTVKRAIKDLEKAELIRKCDIQSVLSALKKTSPTRGKSA